ncbi:MAG: hypothetical protein WDN06_02110 [Asticcacaulis sp.]
MATQGGGRQGQRTRTRDDIVRAAMGLLRTGRRPNAAEVAAAARVSRRTVFLYFPTLDQLLVDARIGLLSEYTIDAALDAVGEDGDAEARMAALVNEIIVNARETLPLGRALIRLTVEQDGSHPKRGARRIRWIEKALAPVRDRLSAEGFERLVSSLAIVIGWEGLIVLGDIRGLGEAAQSETVRWASRALIAAALAEEA